MSPPFVLLALLWAATAAAQPPGPPPVIGPSESPRRSVWQILTPEQREQVWRSLSAEQKVELWRALDPHERRDMRERLGPAHAQPPGAVVGPHRRAFDEGGVRAMLTPEERQRMREQIREANRMRRERLEAEQAGKPVQ